MYLCFILFFCHTFTFIHWHTPTLSLSIDVALPFWILDSRFFKFLLMKVYCICVFIVSDDMEALYASHPQIFRSNSMEMLTEEEMEQLPPPSPLPPGQNVSLIITRSLEG